MRTCNGIDILFIAIPNGVRGRGSLRGVSGSKQAFAATPRDQALCVSRQALPVGAITAGMTSNAVIWHL